MKILVPILGFDRSGGYRVLSEFANYWISAGHTVKFLVPDTSQKPYFPTNADIISSDSLGRTHSELISVAKKKHLQGFYNLLTLYRGLNSIGKNYDIILANQSLTTWPVRFARLGSAKRFYYIQAYEPEYYSLSKAPVKWLLSKISYYLGFEPIVNAPIYCNYKNIKAKKVVPPGVDLNIFYPNNLLKNLKNKDEIVLGCIGRKEPSKGTNYILDAFEKLWFEDKRYRLRVAYGNLPQKWKHPAAEIVVPKNDNELAEYYRSVVILIAAGTVQHGAAHYPVLEAMACGIPVVTTGYLPADRSNSWIVENRDAEAIKNAIISIVTDENYTDRVCRAFEALQEFAWEKAAKAMAGHFEGSLKK